MYVPRPTSLTQSHLIAFFSRLLYDSHVRFPCGHSICTACQQQVAPDTATRVFCTSCGLGFPKPPVTIYVLKDLAQLVHEIRWGP